MKKEDSESTTVGFEGPRFRLVHHVDELSHDLVAVRVEFVASGRIEVAASATELDPRLCLTRFRFGIAEIADERRRSLAQAAISGGVRQQTQRCRSGSG